MESGQWLGEGEFTFGEWPTPFAEEKHATIYEVAYSPVLSHPDLDGETLPESLLSRRPKQALVVRVLIENTGDIYRVSFAEVSAFRVLDEGGLTEFWKQTSLRGGRPAHSTFRVRNHAWTKESFLSFLASDGWSYVIATNLGCVEIVSWQPPIITLEPAI